MELYHNVFSLASHHDNLSLSVLSVVPEKPKAVVQLAHGMCEHKERYLPFMRFLAENGYAAFLNDHRGHSTKPTSVISMTAVRVRSSTICTF